MRFAILHERVTRQRGNDRGFDFGAIEKAGLDFADFAIDAHAGRRAGDEQQVAGAALNHHREPTVEAFGDAGIVVG